MIIERLEVGHLATNCYLVGDEATRAGMVIDPGDDSPVILKRTEALGLNIKVIVLTHAHFDHIGAVKGIKSATNAELLIHVADAQALTSGHSSAALFGYAIPEVPPADRMLNDGDNILLGDSSFRVLHTPGHTPGGICLEGGGVVFSGDTLFKNSIGRADLPGGDYRALIGSIKTRLLTLPDATFVYPGHGPETTIGRERQFNPFLLGR